MARHRISRTLASDYETKKRVRKARRMLERGSNIYRKQRDLNHEYNATYKQGRRWLLAKEVKGEIEPEVARKIEQRLRAKTPARQARLPRPGGSKNPGNKLIDEWNWWQVFKKERKAALALNDGAVDVDDWWSEASEEEESEAGEEEEDNGGMEMEGVDIAGEAAIEEDDEGYEEYEEYDEGDDENEDGGVRLPTREQGQRYGPLLEAMTNNEVDLPIRERGQLHNSTLKGATAKQMLVIRDHTRKP